MVTSLRILSKRYSINIKILFHIFMKHFTFYEMLTQIFFWGQLFFSLVVSIYYTFPYWSLQNYSISDAISNKHFFAILWTWTMGMQVTLPSEANILLKYLSKRENTIENFQSFRFRIIMSYNCSILQISVNSEGFEIQRISWRNCWTYTHIKKLRMYDVIPNPP